MREFLPSCFVPVFRQQASFTESLDRSACVHPRSQLRLSVHRSSITRITFQKKAPTSDNNRVTTGPCTAGGTATPLLNAREGACRDLSLSLSCRAAAAAAAAAAQRRGRGRGRGRRQPPPHLSVWATVSAAKARAPRCGTSGR
jgi:hypothetical protein